jgi:hypothetical protein
VTRFTETITLAAPVLPATTAAALQGSWQTPAAQLQQLQPPEAPRLPGKGGDNELEVGEGGGGCHALGRMDPEDEESGTHACEIYTADGTIWASGESVFVRLF